MSPYFTDEHRLFRQSLRDFLAREIAPHIDAWEAAGEVPRWPYERFGEMGYFGLLFPEKHGGMDVDFFFTVVLLEELQRLNSGGFGAAMGAHAYLSLPHLFVAGSEDLKKRYLEPGIRGEKIGCLAITEPGGGSDVASLRTKARVVEGGYVLDGSKTFITNGVNSDFLVVAAKVVREGEEEGKKRGISMFVVDRKSEGLTATKLDKLGWRASDTGEIALDGVFVPSGNLLGAEGQGFIYIMQRFALERLLMAIGGVGAADYALEITLDYMGQREAFGRPLNRFQELRHRVANMASEIEMQRQFVYHVCRCFDDGHYVVKEAAMAKLLATQLNDKVAYDCLQMFGGYGFMEDFPLARMYRDSRLGTIGGGTSEIMCEIISKMLIDDKSYTQ